MIVCEEEGELVDFCSVRRIGDNRAELNNLAESPNRRHSGIGNKLIEQEREEAARLSCDSIEIGIVEENTRLKNWYISKGFIHTGTKKYDFFPFTCGYLNMKL